MQGGGRGGGSGGPEHLLQLVAALAVSSQLLHVGFPRHRKPRPLTGEAPTHSHRCLLAAL